MNKKQRLTWRLSYLLIVVSLVFSQVSTSREIIDLNPGWTFTGTDVFSEPYQQQVDLPHSWNGAETWNPDLNRTVSLEYSRGENHYQKNLDVPAAWQNKRLIIRFEAANTVARLSINGRPVGEHRGGYSAFNFDITEFVNFGEVNTIDVLVDNSPDDDIMPLFGDFNIYGGLIRPVSLIVAENTMISLAQHGSSGVYIKQKHLAAEYAEIEVLTHIDHHAAAEQRLTLVSSVFDGNDALLESVATDITVSSNSASQHRQKLVLENPRLWRGVSDPYLYRINVSLRQGDKILDEINEPLGLRTIAIDPEGRLLLNGQVYRLKGVGLHEDWPGVGPALTRTQRARDIELITSMGANAIRLAHYPHGKETLELADKAGLVVWSEIPFVGLPFGTPLGYTDSEAFKENARQQLVEMIHQRFNHPSVFFWGIYNELQTRITEQFNPRPLLYELNELAGKLDPGRLTASASAGDGEEGSDLNQITKVQFWNRYYGWYLGQAQDLGLWLDETKKIYPQRGIGVSEYGAGGSIASYKERLSKPYGHGDRDHPEKWQSYLHQRSWNEIQQRDFLIGTFVWAMFDFSSSLRKEGGYDGLNTKGLVSYDRKVTKDAFHFYQANWSEKPMLYIADRRSIGRLSGSAEVKVYSNAEHVELWNNHQSLGRKTGDNGVFVWADISIEPGNNLLVVKAEHSGQALSDRVIWYYNDKMVLLSKLMPVFTERHTYVIVALLILLLFFSWGYRKRLEAVGVMAAKTGFWVLAVATVLYLLAVLVLQFMGLLSVFN